MIVLKLCCCGIIIYLCAVAGKKRAYAIKIKADTQLELATSLLKIKSLIVYDSTPIKNILSSQLSDNPYVILFYQQILKLLNKNPELSLGELARTSASQLEPEQLRPPFLLASDALKEIECADISHSSARLAIAYESLKKSGDADTEVYRQKANLYRSIGILSGLLASILII